MSEGESGVADQIAGVGPASSTVARDHSPAYLRYVLGVLFLGAALSFANQQLINILVEPIKREFGATDTEMGLLTGFAFVLCYAALSMPIARLADRSSRRNILAIATALWSAMTAACGVSANFWQLAAARFAIGIGEAGGGPVSHSMLADYFPPHRRGTAFGILAAGPLAGVLISMFGGAVIATHYGWRSAFVALGVPSMLLAMVIGLTIREPRRGRWDPPSSTGASGLRIREVLLHLWRDPATRTLALASSAAAVSNFALAAWTPSFFIRVHGLSLIEVGIGMGLGGTLGGIAGSISGGMLADRLVARHRSWQLKVAALGCLLSPPATALVLLWPSGDYWTVGTLRVPTIFAWVPVGAFLMTLMQGPAAAAVQNLIAPAIRTQVTAAFSFFTTAIGMGLGPLGVGMLSDALAPAAAENSLRYGLLASLSSVFVGGLLFWRAGNLYAAALSRRPE
jgi:MFS family permease